MEPLGFLKQGPNWENDILKILIFFNLKDDDESKKEIISNKSKIKTAYVIFPLLAVAIVLIVAVFSIYTYM